MASRLSIYNGALRHLGERRLVNLTEERAARRELDACYGDTIDRCLQGGFWNFALRSVKMVPSDDLEPSFGFDNVYVKPEDWVRTFVVSESERFDPPLLHYTDEGSYWFADATELYVRYVSKATDYGRNEALWPPNFTDYVEVQLAYEIAPTIKADRAEGMYKLAEKMRAKAMSLDAMDEPPGFAPQGTWASSRSGGRSTRGSLWNGRWDNGNG